MRKGKGREEQGRFEHTNEYRDGCTSMWAEGRICTSIGNGEREGWLVSSGGEGEQRYLWEGENGEEKLKAEEVIRE